MSAPGPHPFSQLGQDWTLVFKLASRSMPQDEAGYLSFSGMVDRLSQGIFSNRNDLGLSDLSKDWTDLFSLAGRMLPKNSEERTRFFAAAEHISETIFGRSVLPATEVADPSLHPPLPPAATDPPLGPTTAIPGSSSAPTDGPTSSFPAPSSTSTSQPQDNSATPGVLTSSLPALSSTSPLQKQEGPAPTNSQATFFPAASSTSTSQSSFPAPSSISTSQTQEGPTPTDNLANFFATSSSTSTSTSETQEGSTPTISLATFFPAPSSTSTSISTSTSTSTSSSSSSSASTSQTQDSLVPTSTSTSQTQDGSQGITSASGPFSSHFVSTTDLSNVPTMNDYFWMNKMAGYQNASSSLPATSAWGVNHMSMPFPTTPSSSVQQRDTPWKSAGHSHYRTNTTPSSDLDTFWTYPGGWAEASLAETLGDGSEEVSAVIADKPTATPGEAPSSCSLARQAASRPSGPAKITGKRMEKPRIITGELNSESNGSPVKRRRGQPLGDVTNGQATDNYLQQAPNADKPRQNEALASMPAGMHFLLELLNYRKKIRAPVIVSQVCRLLLFRRGLLDEDEQQIFDDFVAKDRSGLVEGAVQRSLSASHLMVLEASQYIHLGCNHELVEVSAGRQLRALIGVPDQADPFYSKEQAVLDWDEHNECFAESQT